MASGVSGAVVSTFVQWAGKEIVGSLLDGLIDKVKSSVDGVISHAAGAVQEATIEAGKQAITVIETAKTAYQESLTMTVEQVEQAVQTQMYELNTMVEEFQAGNLTLVDQTAKRVQLIINGLPFMAHRPYLTSATPPNVALGSKADVDLKFEGNFPYLGDPAYPVSLTFNGKSTTLVGSKTEALIFKAQLADLFPEGAARAFSYASGDLRVAWDNTASLSWIWRALGYTKIETNTYKVLVSALPDSPGSITAIYLKPGAGPLFEQAYESGVVRGDANVAYKAGSCIRDGHFYPFEHVFTPTDGFQFVPSTVRYVADPGNHGIAQGPFVTVAPDQVKVGWHLDACSGKHMGIVNFHVVAREVKGTDAVSSKNYDLKWGGQVILPLKTTDLGNLQKVVYQGFDGIPVDFGLVSDLSNPFVKVRNQGAALEVKAVIPADPVNLSLAYRG